MMDVHLREQVAANPQLVAVETVWSDGEVEVWVGCRSGGDGAAGPALLAAGRVGLAQRRGAARPTTVRALTTTDAPDGSAGAILEANIAPDGGQLRIVSVILRPWTISRDGTRRWALPIPRRSDELLPTTPLAYRTL